MPDDGICRKSPDGTAAISCKNRVDRKGQPALSVSIRALMLWHLSREIVVPMDTRGGDSRHLQCNNSNRAEAG
jgi:hypothetical protein